MQKVDELYNFDPSSRVDVALYESDTTEQQASQIFDSIKDDIFGIRLRQLLWQEYCRKNVDDTKSLEADIASIVDDNGIREIIKTTTVKIYERSAALNMHRHRLDPSTLSSRRSTDELVECVRNARIQWEDGINEELHAIVRESHRPFLILRQSGETSPHLETLDFVDAPKAHQRDSVKFLFDSEDLLETGVSIVSPNVKPVHNTRYMGLIKLNLEVLSLDQLCKKFIELGANHAQFGIDERWGSSSSAAKFCHSRHEIGDSLARSGDSISARLFMRKGVPPSLRPHMYRAALGLGSEVTASEESTFATLRKSCDQMDLLTDKLLVHDIETVTDDPRFFVFEDEIKDTIFAFSRDEWVRQNCHYEIHRPILDLMDGSAAPPCGIQPFLGLSAYTAPLCYIFRSRASLYSISREMFCRLWCKMNVLSADSGTLLSVCKTFECLLIEINPHLFIHLMKLNAQPLKIAFPWLQLGFVGLLEIEQILLLWDRVIGFMDLTVLAVAAASIFVYRSEPLFKCTSEAEVNAVVSEASRLRIIPLMQMLLFKEGNSR